MTWHSLAADAILSVHVLIVAFVVLGQLLIMIGGVAGWRWVRHFWFRLAHLATIAFVALQAWLGELCPLTVWEQRLRELAGEAHYRESFVEHWLSQWLFFDAPWWLFIAAYTAFAMLVALSWRWIPPRRRGR